MASSLTMFPIPAGDEREKLWQGEVRYQEDGVTVSYAKLTSKYGTLTFGKGSDGRVGWSWQETGGGGSMTILYALEPGMPVLDGLWIGLLAEIRENMGPGHHLCLVGGFQKPDESHLAAHRREFGGETGGEIGKDWELEGLPLVSNRMYFEADPNAGEGCHPFAMQVPFGDLFPAADGTREHSRWKPKGNRIVFMPWRMAAQQTADALAGLPILRLLAELIK